VGFCYFTANTFLAWHALSESTFGPPKGMASKTATLVPAGDRCAKGAGWMGLTPPQTEKLQLSRFSFGLS
jgi:hypothetical protein